MMDANPKAAAGGQQVVDIVSVAAKSENSELIMDLVGHPKGMVSHKEFAILNPEASKSSISRRLSELQEAGVVEKVPSTDQSPGEPRAFFYLTDTAREVFDRNNMFDPEPLRELFNRIEHSDEFKELVAKPRPDVDADTVDPEATL
jgi:DNA-binding HxlR family transcriptional regulator